MDAEEETLHRRVAYVPAGSSSKSLWALGELVTCKITSSQTSGAYTLFEVVSQPGDGPPPHVQHREDEAFYVLEGEYDFLDEGRTMKVGAGALIFVPRGNLHAYKKVGRGPGRMLIIQTPGGLYEGFFEEIGEKAKGTPEPLLSESPQDMERIAKIAAEYGIEMPSTSCLYYR